MSDSLIDATDALVNETAETEIIQSDQVIECFPDSMKKNFQLWINDKVNKGIFDSSKRTRYKWILDTPDAPIHETKMERRIKFNERHDVLTHFVLKNKQLYRKISKPEKYDRIVAFDYNVVDIIKKIHNELKHVGNFKNFRRINEMYYGIFKIMMK